MAYTRQLQKNPFIMLWANEQFKHIEVLQQGLQRLRVVREFSRINCTERAESAVRLGHAKSAFKFSVLYDITGTLVVYVRSMRLEVIDCGK